MGVRYSPANEILLTLQLLSGFLMNYVTVGSCALATVFAMHVCGQLSVVISRLNGMVANGGICRFLALAEKARYLYRTGVSSPISMIF